MAVIVFGANGFLGKNIIHELSKEGLETLALSRSFDSDFFQDFPEVKCHQIDFRSPSTYEKYLKEGDTVVHLIYMGIPYKANENKSADILNNLVPSVELAEICAQRKIKRLVFASSGGAVYGKPREDVIKETHPRNPVNSYGITRLATEKYIRSISRETKMDYAILRISNPYGRYSKVDAPIGIFNKIESCLINDEVFELRAPLETTRDYVPVEEVAASFVKMTNYSGIICDTFNVSSGKGMSIGDVIGSLERKHDRKLKVVHVSSSNPEVLVNVLDNSKIKNFS